MVEAGLNVVDTLPIRHVTARILEHFNFLLHYFLGGTSLLGLGLISYLQFSPIIARPHLRSPPLPTNLFHFHLCGGAVILL